MAKEDVSIISSKSSFLNAQTRLLSAPLQLSSTYRTTLYASDSALSSKAVSDIVNKVNDKIRAHNRLVFAPQSIRHVAEQIETLYWNEVREDLRDRSAEGDLVAVERDVELSEEGTLVLPEDLEDAMLEEGETDAEEAERYARLRAQLVALSERRDGSRRKLQSYEKMKELLEPYEDPQKNIQPNLVTKDGELSKELDRMRVLLARVNARMGEYDSVKQKHVQKEAKGFDQKLQEVMDLG